MKKITKYILRSVFTLSLVFTSACSDYIDIPDINPDVPSNGDEITITGRIEIPGLQESTRGFTAGIPTLNDLYLYMVVFNDNDDPNINPFQYVKKVSRRAGDADQNIYCYDVTLDATTRNAIIHLIAIDDPNFMDNFTTIGGEYHIMAGLTTSTTDNPEPGAIGEGAYWQRIKLECPIREEYQEQILEKLGGKKDGIHKPVPLVRNYAMVEVNDKEIQDNNAVSYEGFEIINSLNTGTIAPFLASDDIFSSDVRFYSFADYSNNSWTPWDWAKINAEYSGRRANGATRIHLAENANDFSYDNSPKFMYERPFQSSNHTFVVIKVKYGGSDNYYKVDLGVNDENNIFSYYNIIRNVKYTINIKAVTGAGYSTALEAANGLASNNFSAAVETRNLLSVSDGDKMISVSHTRYVFVKNNEEFEFGFQYFTDMENGGTINNGLVKFNTSGIGIQEGNVVDDWGYYNGNNWVSCKNNTNANLYQTLQQNGWVKFVIKAKNPTNATQTQTFTIYDPNGLNRTITLILRNPWPIIDPAEYAGQWNDKTSRPAESLKGVAGGQKGAYLTVFFELPADLPEVIFPLEFVLEADKQNIQNDYSAGSAAVQNGPSLFEEVSSTRIQYVKTVNWSDYDMASGEHPNASHNVRARFMTITDLGGFVYTDSETIIRIYNPYFNMAECSFTRKQGQDPDPEH